MPIRGLDSLHCGALFVGLILAFSSMAEEDRPRGFLGLQYAYEETADAIPEGRFRVRELYPGGAAEKAGLRVDDVIMAVNGVKFRFADELDIASSFSWVEPGDEVELAILRDGSPLEILLVADSEPESIAKARPEVERQVRTYRAQQMLRRLAQEEDGVTVTVIRDRASGGFRAEIAGVEPEIRQDIAEFIGTRRLQFLVPNMKDGDRIKVHFQARPREPGSGSEPESRRPEMHILEAPPHIWGEDSASEKKTSSGQVPDH